MSSVPRSVPDALRALARESAGRRLPPERELARQLGVSRPHLRTVLDDLEREGLIARRRGSGTYALDAPGTAASPLERVTLLIDAELKLGDDPFFSLVLERLQRGLQAARIRCGIERLNAGATSRPYIPAPNEGIVTLGRAGQTFIDALRAPGPPTVGLFVEAAPAPKTRVSRFLLDDAGAGQAAARHLLAQGCRTLLFIGRRDVASSAQRLSGVETVVAEEGAGASLRVVECSLNYAAGLQAGREMGLPSPADAPGIVAANDWLAAGLHAGLCARKDAAPFPIVSFDGLALTSGPGITSLTVPVEAIAEDTVAELLRLHGSPVAVGRTVQYSLHERDGSASLRPSQRT